MSFTDGNGLELRLLQRTEVINIILEVYRKSRICNNVRKVNET